MGWKELPVWGKGLVIVGVGGASYIMVKYAMSDGADTGTSTDGGTGTGSRSPGGPSVSSEVDDALFEAFWQVAGREESRNKWDFWVGADLGGKPSIGWLNFNQSFSIHLLMVEAARDNPSVFSAAFGPFANMLKNPEWTKNANLNEPSIRGRMLAWLRSPQGQRIQRLVGRKYYFGPAMEMINRIRPNTDRVYRVVVASTRVLRRMSTVEAAFRSNPTAQDFTNYFKREYGDSDIRFRFDRQLRNAVAMLSRGALAIT